MAGQIVKAIKLIIKQKQDRLLNNASKEIKNQVYVKKKQQSNRVTLSNHKVHFLNFIMNDLHFT